MDRWQAWLVGTVDGDNSLWFREGMCTLGLLLMSMGCIRSISTVPSGPFPTCGTAFVRNTAGKAANRLTCKEG
jgi:hypothetical protein